MVDGVPLERFRDKLDRELKSGLVTVLLLLVIDRTGPDYGYRILKTIQERSEGHLSFKEGTAYPLLQNLERMGLVSTYWGQGDAGPPRKYYQITSEGRTALRHALDDWEALAGSVALTVANLGPAQPAKKKEEKRHG